MMRCGKANSTPPPHSSGVRHPLYIQPSKAQYKQQGEFLLFNQVSFGGTCSPLTRRELASAAVYNMNMRDMTCLRVGSTSYGTKLKMRKNEGTKIPTNAAIKQKMCHFFVQLFAQC
jgi:hypothetical protein